MKVSKVFKKLSAIVMMFAMIFGLFGITGSGITAKASTNPVNMYCYDFVYSKYGYTEYNVYIQVEAGSAGSKAVYVHYDAGNSVWQDQAATFLTKIDDNTEIWKATVGGFGIGEEYAIKYIGDGQTYWDNNNGNNYTGNDILGQANVKVKRLNYQTPSSFKVQATVKNLAYNKVVKVRYTQDNWVTYQDAALSYEAPITGTNAETWGVTLNLDESKMDDFHYCVSYQVNGTTTYWDNNFGANYDKSYYRVY